MEKFYKPVVLQQQLAPHVNTAKNNDNPFKWVF